MNVLELLNKSAYGMTKEEAIFMLDYYNSKEDAYMHHDKVEKLEKQLVRLESRKSRQAEQENEVVNIINEIESIKSKWKAQGAYYESNTSYDKWYYNGVNLFIFWSRTHVKDIIEELRKADSLFEELTQ